MTNSFWYGIFWPYFQFAVFIAFLIYVARAPITKFLASKRDEFKTKLSEAHEALTLAEGKIAQYESKIHTLTQEVEDIKQRYLQDASFEKEKILQEANRSAEVILNDAKRTAFELISQTQEELKTDMLKLVLAEFNKQLTAERLKKLESEFQKEAVRSIPLAFEQNQKK